MILFIILYNAFLVKIRLVLRANINMHQTNSGKQVTQNLLSLLLSYFVLDWTSVVG